MDQHPAIHPTRYARLDALRGLAMLWMAVFHFDYDLNHFGFIVPKHRFFVDAFWVNQRTAILSLFLFTAGVSLAVALSRRQTWTAFSKRWWQIALAAALVSLGSWWMFPRAWIWFGVLHAMAVMLVLARLLAPLRAGLLALAALALVLPRLVKSSFFDAHGLSWLGLGVVKPVTQDWVPLLPWFGVMLLGLAVGQWLVQRRQAWLAGPVSPGFAPLVTLGQWSLVFYVLHQPIFFGLVSWVASLR